MIVMTPDATEAQIGAVRAKLETVGVHVLVMPGELTTAIGALGDPEGVRELGLEGMEGVDRVVLTGPRGTADDVEALVAFVEQIGSEVIAKL